MIYDYLRDKVLLNLNYYGDTYKLLKISNFLKSFIVKIEYFIKFRSCIVSFKISLNKSF